MCQIVINWRYSCGRATCVISQSLSSAELIVRWMSTTMGKMFNNTDKKICLWLIKQTPQSIAAINIMPYLTSD